MTDRKRPMPADRLLIDMSSLQVNVINQLLADGYGATPADVVEYLLQRSIDDLIRSGVVKTIDTSQT